MLLVRCLRTVRPVALGALAAGMLSIVPPAMCQYSENPNPPAQLAHDPVDALRQVLRVPLIDPGRNPQELTARRDALTQAVGRLRGLGDLRRALLLHEWLDEDQDPQVASVDRSVRNSIVARLQTSLRNMLDRGSPTAQLAAATMIGDIGISIRGAGTGQGADTQGIVRGLAPDLARVAESGDEPAVRQAATSALCRINPDPKVAGAALSQVMESDQVGLRRVGAEGLARLIREVSQIIPSRGKSVTGVTASPADVVQMGVAVVPVATKGFNDSDAEVRRASVDAVLQSAIALTDLLPASREAQLLGEEQPAVASFVRALGEAAPELGRALNDPDARVRLQACRGLEDLANARLRLARRAGDTTLPPPAKDTGEQPRGDTAPPESPFHLTAEEQPARVPLGTRLVQRLRDVLPDAEQRLSDPDVEVRLAVLDFLEVFGPDAAPAVPAIIKSLNDPVLFVRWAAARTLGKIGPVQTEHSVPALAGLLRDPDLDVRMATATVLERYGSAARDAVPELTRTTQVGDAEIRIAALRALAAVGPSAASGVPEIAQALDNPDVRVRRTAAEVLGRLGASARDAEGALRRALTDPDADVRRAASDALLNILSEESGPAPEELEAPKPVKPRSDEGTPPG